MSHLKYILCFVSFPLFATLFDPAALEHRAEVEGYGYKTANLMELRELFKHEERIKVPEFIGLPSPLIQHLLAQAGLDLRTSWSQIQWAQGVASKTLGDAISSKTLPTSFLTPSLKLAEQIKSRFAALSTAHLPELDAFLADAKANHWRLMVRSTGKEDTDKLANAGGNKSIGNVSAELHAVMNAIGQVIASYFEEKSLSQRLIASDTTLFDLPLTPVLIQRMIGEELNGAQSVDHIPVGCVLYTLESAAKIGEIYTLQCAYGHNEGVVESLVPLDTYYIDKSVRIQSIVAIKTKRIVPVVENNVFGLEEKDNPKSIQNAPALSRAGIHHIGRAGDIIDGYYKKRMDVELAYEPWTQTAYIVQARPLVIPQSTEEPSYLTQVTSISSSDLLPITSINPGDSAVLRIRHPYEVLTARTLDDALHLYTEGQVDRARLRAVIVGAAADPTSHAAAVFRGDSKTIFVCEDLPRLEAWLNEPQQNLMLDSQRGIIANVSKQIWANNEIRNLFETRVLKAGWLSYPLPLRVSVGVHQPEYCLAPQMKLENLFGEMICLTDRLEDQVRELNRFTEQTREDAHCDLNNPDCLEKHTLANQVLPKLENINTHAHELLKQIKTDPQDSSSELLGLFPKRFLEAIVDQPAKGNLADAYSFKSIQEEYADGQHFVEELRPLINTHAVSDRLLRDPERFRIAHLGEKASLTNKTSERFLRFVDETPESHKAKLAELVDAFDGLGILPMWVNSKFMSAASSLTTAGDKLLDHFYTTYLESKRYLQNLQNKKAQIIGYDLSVWGNPNNFLKVRQDFKNKFESYFTSNAFLGFTNDLQLMAAVSVMERYIELFDNSIKTLKSTPNPSVANFKIRIQDYLHTLETWGPKAPQEFVTYHANWNLETYLGWTKRTLDAKKETQPTELQPSREFNVAAAAIGAATEFQRHVPRTFEDYFTFIHQSLNTFMGAWNTKALNDLVLPESFANAWRQLQDKQFPVFLTGIQVGNGSVDYSINMPLESHSAKMKLSFRRSEDSVKLTFYLLGPARNRWNLIRDYALFESEEQKLPLSNIVRGADELNFTFDSVNLNPALSLTDIKNTVGSTANDEIWPQTVLDRIFLRYPGENLKDWIIDHEAVGLAIELATDRSNQVESPRYRRYSTINPKAVLQIAQKFANSLDANTQSNVMSLLGLISEEDFKKAVPIIQKLSTIPNASVQSSLQGIFIRNLVERGVGLQELAEVAANNSKSSNPLLKTGALLLYLELANAERYRPDALKAAAEAVSSSDTSVMEANILLLFVLLQSYDLGIEPAMRLLEKAVYNPNIASPNYYLSYILSMISNKDFEPEARKSLAAGLVQKDFSQAQLWALRLYQSLHYRKHVTTDELMKAIHRASSDKNQQVLYEVADAAKQIGEHNPEWSLQLAKTLEKRTDEDAISAAISIFESLINQDYNLAFQPALEASSKALDNGNLELKQGALNLLIALVSRNFGIRESLQAIKKVTIRNGGVGGARFRLLQTLIEKDSGLGEATQEAMDLVRDPISWHQANGLELFEMLVKKNIAVAEATAAIKILENSSDHYVQNKRTNLVDLLKSEGHLP